MTRKHKPGNPEPVVREAAGQNPPVIIPPPHPPGAVPAAPISKGVDLQAQKLLHEAGSSELAKVAVDIAKVRETIPDFREDQFAQRWGFPSRQEMLAASTPITAPDGGAWWGTQLKNDRWIVWTQENMAANESFETLEQARQSVYVQPPDGQASKDRISDVAGKDVAGKAEQTKPSTRSEREVQLNGLLKSEGGLDKISEIYKSECAPPGSPHIDLTHGQMVQQILDREFPPELLGLAQKKAPSQNWIGAGAGKKIQSRWR